MKILTVYFSKTGHTKAVAEIIRETVGGDLFEVKTKRTYSASYGIAVLQSGIERFRNTLPELESLPDISAYDRIFIGSPVWWFTLTPAVKSLIAGVDWKNKTVCPFFTSGGQPNHTGEDFKAFLENKGAEVPGYLHVFYRKNRMETEISTITEWAENCADAQSE